MFVPDYENVLLVTLWFIERQLVLRKPRGNRKLGITIVRSTPGGIHSVLCPRGH